MDNALLRIKQFIDSQGIKVSAFEKSVGFSNGSFASQVKNGRTIGVDKLVNILTTYPELNPTWVLLGEGEMILHSEEKEKVERFVHATEGSASGVPVHTLPPTEKETDMSEKEIIEMQKGYIASLKFQVDTLTKENQALAKELKSSKSHEEVVKNM